MNLLSVISMEVEKNDRNYRLSIPMGSPFGEAYDIVFGFLQKIREMAENSENAEKQKVAPQDQPAKQDA